MKFRLLLTGYNDAFTNMAIDESVMVHVGQGVSPPTIRLYGWSPPAVSIGYFQGLEEEVDLNRCANLGIDYIRRITGGGAVFHESEVTYSFSILETSLLIPNNVLESYKFICGGIVEGLKELGIDSEFAPLNDIIVNGRKISGSAQTRRNRTILQHGTVLIDTDVEKMFSVLKVPQEKIKDKLIKEVKDRVTSLKGALGREVEFQEVCQALAKGFERSLEIELEKGELTDTELRLAKDINEERYHSEKWNHRR